MQILVKHDTITPKLRELSRFFASGEFVSVCSKSLLADTVAYYEEKGGRFWPRLGGGFAETSLERLPRISIVGYDAAILIHKRDGGTVVPKMGRRLAIPTRNNPNREKWPSHYGDDELVPMFGRNGLYGLASARMMASIKRSTAGLRGKARSAAIDRLRTFAQMFTLVKFAVHQPDPEALPPADRTMQAVLNSATEAVAAKIST